MPTLGILAIHRPPGLVDFLLHRCPPGWLVVTRGDGWLRTAPRWAPHKAHTDGISTQRALHAAMGMNKHTTAHRDKPKRANRRVKLRSSPRKGVGEYGAGLPDGRSCPNLIFPVTPDGAIRRAG